MYKLVKHYIGKEEILLHPLKVGWFPRLATMVLADLHLGKVNHFRKSGIPVPLAANNRNNENLILLLMELKPERVIFIGDLFHSAYNEEWEVMGQITKSFPNCSFELVPGNHDIMSSIQYEKHGIRIHPEEFALSDQITLRHDPPTILNSAVYYLCGHLHPAVLLAGKARQAMRFPCFWFGATVGVLPAFGAFTGFKSVRPSQGDKIFAIANGEILSM